MIGPSSSHTAGAARLGRIARCVLGAPPEAARIELHGSFARTGRGHGTTTALVAGLLGLAVDDERLRDSPAMAAAAGIRVDFEAADLGEAVHPNTARLTLRAGADEVEVIGASLGGGVVEITHVQGLEARFRGDYATLLVVGEDRPGTVQAVTGHLAGRDINIAFLRVGRRHRGGDAVMVIETDQPVPDPVVAAVVALPWVRWVRRVEKVDE